jgi:hypothetical protein
MRTMLIAIALFGTAPAAVAQPAIDINKRCSEEADARGLRDKERAEYRAACKERLGQQPTTADGKKRAACIQQMRALNPTDAPSPYEPAGMNWIAKCMAKT